MPIIPDNDPNEAYEVAPMKVEPHGPPADWWTITCNGIPVRHFTPHARDAAERYIGSVAKPGTFITDADFAKTA
jgi:hypothetical protein